jgi:hypothetical protein
MDFAGTTGVHGGNAVTTETRTETDRPQQAETLSQLLKRAEQGDLSALPRLREALDADARLWQVYGDLAEHASGALIKLAAGSNLFLAESLMRKVQALKGELGGESPSAMERLLVQRVTATWLQTNYYDGLAAQPAGGGDARLKMIQKLQDAAHRRHLAALKTYAVVKKLLKPAPSPVEVATRLDRGGTPARLRREGIAGTVGVTN